MHETLKKPRVSLYTPTQEQEGATEPTAIDNADNHPQSLVL